jgi:hypothetical protein
MGEAVRQPTKARHKELVLSAGIGAWHKKTNAIRCRATCIPVSRRSSAQSKQRMR